MTREETIELRAAVGRLMYSDNKDIRDYNALIDFIESALRPVSQEQVEKVWRGEWIGDNGEKVGTIDGSPIKSTTCSVCGNWLVGSDEYDCCGNFCPACGRAMTDEAVEMVMERMEALHAIDT